MIDLASIPTSDVEWKGAVRIIRSLFPPIDLFEDIADPADWALILAAEQKTNPRVMEAVGNLDLVPLSRRISGQGASYLMAPFSHVSKDRPSRFSDGTHGVLYVGDRFETALFETIHHHGRFMSRTHEAPGWTSQFREIVLDLAGQLKDLRAGQAAFGPFLTDDYEESQALGAAIKAAALGGVVYPSVRFSEGECVGLFYPDLARPPQQGRHLDYHWDGKSVDMYREPGSGRVFRIE